MKEINHPAPTATAIREMYRNRKAGFISQKIHFSVLIPLVEIQGEVHLLFETRASALDVQPGEICFPGGAVEEGENYSEAALRETREEIGVSEEEIELLGEGDMLTHNPRFVIHSYVGLLKNVHPKEGESAATGIDGENWRESWRGYLGEELRGLRIGKEEVEDVFTIPLRYFLEHPPRVEWVGVEESIPEDFPYDLVGQDPSYRWYRSKYSVIIYDYPGRYLWGMTAKIALQFAETVGGKKIVDY